MMKYKKWALLLVITTVVALSGCRTTVGTVSLLQAPKISNENQEDIKKAIDNFLPDGVVYVPAINDEGKPAIFTEDINHDGNQVAFALYNNIKGNQKIHLLVLNENNRKWNKVSDIATNYDILDYFKTEDLNQDGKKELIVGIGSANSESRKELNIYEWQGKDLVKKVDRAYEKVDIDDYDGDGKPDIIILDGERNKSQTAEMFSYGEGQLASRSTLSLDTYGFHENIVSGRLTDRKKAIFIDSGLGAHSMLTEIVAYDKGKLIKVGDENDGILFKAYPLYSKDINNDGVTEVGGMYIPKGFENAAMAEIPFIHVYVDYGLDGTRQTIEQRYCDSEQHFFITIPSKWYGRVTIKKIENGVELVSNDEQKILFQVKWISKDAYNDYKTKLSETIDTVFYTDIKEMTDIPYDNFHMIKD